jgi:small subunit ribosomal protein S14
MAEIPRNANPTRCSQPLRPHRPSRANYRKFGLSRIMIRELGNRA